MKTTKSQRELTERTYNYRNREGKVHTQSLRSLGNSAKTLMEESSANSLDSWVHIQSFVDSNYVIYRKFSLLLCLFLVHVNKHAITDLYTLFYFFETGSP